MTPLRAASARMRREDGWVVVVAVVLMTIMVGVGLAILSIVDTQAKQSGNERMRESTFNLAEGLLTAEARILQRNWPTKPPCTGNLAKCGYVPVCTEAAMAPVPVGAIPANPPNQCPDKSELLSSGAPGNQAFNNTDQIKATTWRVEVRDDVGAVVGNGTNPIYDAAVQNATNASCQNAAGSTPALCTYDQNNNNRLWVRVDATIPRANGERPFTRSMVALLQLERLSIPFPAAAVSAGSVDFSNAGTKQIVDSTGSLIIVRCHANPSTVISPTSLLAQGTNFTNVADGTPGDFFDSKGNGIQVVVGGGAPELLRVLTAVADGAGGTHLVFTSVAGSPHPAGSVVMRAPSSDNTCETWNQGQLSPPFNYVENPDYQTGPTAEDLALIEDGATVYDNGTCPNQQDPLAWAGPIVIKLAPPGGCVFNPNGAAVVNTAAQPGFIIVENQQAVSSCSTSAGQCAALQITGNTTYHGVVWMPNQQQAGAVPPASPPGYNPVLKLGGNVQVCGGVAIDGPGKIFIGQASGGNSTNQCNPNAPGAPTIVFDAQAFKGFGAAGAAGLVQNTWRELTPPQQLPL